MPKNKTTKNKTPRKNKAAGQKKTRSRNPFALSATLPKGKPGKSAVQHIPWSELKVENLNPLLGVHFVVGENIMLARVLLKKGCIVPRHCHPNEQLSFVAQGALKFFIDGREIVVRSGEVLTIPPNLPHQVEAIEDTVDFDIFHPPRADWMNKTNQYLR